MFPQIVAPSSYSLNLLALPMLGISAAVLVIAIRTLFHEGINRISITFALLAVSIFLWCFPFAWMYCSVDPQVALWLAKAAYLGVPFIPAALYHFVVSVLGIYDKEKRLVWLIWAFSMMSSAIIVGTDLVIRDVYRFPWGFAPRYTSGPWGGLHIVSALVLYGLSLTRLWRAYPHAPPAGNQNQRIKLFIIAFSIGATAFVDYLPSMGIRIYPFGFLSIFAAVVIIARAIRKYRLVDITPRFAAESILSTMDDALLVLDAERVIRLVNHSAVTLLGLTEERLLGTHFSRIFGDNILSGHASFARKDNLHHYEFTYKHRERGSLTISLSSSSMKDEEGQLLATVCIARDITHLKQAEAALLHAQEVLEKKVEERTSDLQRANEQLMNEVQERKSAEDALRRSEENYRMVVSSISASVWRIQFDPTLQPCSSYFSDVADRLLGLPAGTLGHDLEKFLAFVHSDDLPSVRKTLQYGLDNPGTLISKEYRVHRRDGVLRWFRTTGMANRSQKGQLQAFGTTEDVTTQKTLEQQIFQQQKLEGIGLLAGGIAHDLNNLLTPIIGYAELIRMRVAPDDRIHAQVSSILDASHRAKNLVKQLLSFSRKQIMRLARYDLNELISTFVKILRSTIRENIEIHEELSADACLIFADRSQTEQILLNLAVNAQDAIMDNGAITIQTGHVLLDDEYCQIHPEVRPGRYVMMGFSDSGCGMDEETLHHIFEPFFTSKPVGRGTGLGLSTVYGIVTQHEGRVSVESRIGFGTTFNIYLPEAAATANGWTPPDEEARGAMDAAGTILLVEDNVMAREVTRDMLEMHGHRVLPAETPGKALEIASDHGDNIDLLVTDIVMPEMNGIELHRRLHEIVPDLKALFISGYTDIGAVHKGILDEKVNFLPKPFTAEGILKKIAELFHSRTGAVMENLYTKKGRNE